MAGAEIIGEVQEFTDVTEIFVDQALTDLAHHPQYANTIHDAWVRSTTLYPGHSPEAVARTEGFMRGVLYTILEDRQQRGLPTKIV